MDRTELIAWLREESPARLADLWQLADETRQRCVGGDVHLRGLVEISNHCVRLCGYCGLRAPNTTLQRYRMSADEIVACAHQAVAFGYGTTVLQAGEDPALTGDWVADVVRRIKRETPLAVTLSLGERTDDELALWRAAGADRYLLRFETSNPKLFARIHPPRPGVPSDRVAILRRLGQLGYEVGSGVMIGIPGQTYDDLAADLELFGQLDLDMIGVGPYLPHPETPLGDPADDEKKGTVPDQASLGARRNGPKGAAHKGGLSPFFPQVPNTELMTYKVIALARLVCPKANIPSTTALATLNRARGRELGLVRGANIVMPNLTPPQYRIHYEIYPNKACITESGETCHSCMEQRIENLGRTIGAGRGDSPNYRHNDGLLHE